MREEGSVSVVWRMRDVGAGASDRRILLSSVRVMLERRGEGIIVSRENPWASVHCAKRAVLKWPEVWE